MLIRYNFYPHILFLLNTFKWDWSLFTKKLYINIKQCIFRRAKKRQIHFEVCIFSFSFSLYFLSFEPYFLMIIYNKPQRKTLNVELLWWNDNVACPHVHSSLSMEPLRLYRTQIETTDFKGRNKYLHCELGVNSSKPKLDNKYWLQISLSSPWQRAQYVTNHWLMKRRF